MQGEIKEVGKYIDMGVDVYLVHKNRTTPLMFAIWGNQYEIVKLVISKGADVYAQTNDGETALHRAEKIDKAKLADMTEIIEIIKESGVK